MKRRPSLKVLAGHALGLSLVATTTAGCGVNSGNPTGKPGRSSVSIYLQSSPASTLDSFKIRVRGLQLVSGPGLEAPAENSYEEMLFEEMKTFDLLDFSENAPIVLFQDKAVVYRDYRQVRLLLDRSHAGNALTYASETINVHAIPLDLFAAAQNGSAPDGGRQADQMLATGDGALIKQGGAASVVLNVDLAHMLLPPKDLRPPMTSFFLEEKGLTQAAIDTSLFLRPMPAARQAVIAAESLGVVKTHVDEVANGLMCVFPAAAQAELSGTLSSLTSDCEQAAYVVPIRGNRIVTTLPLGDYVGVTFDDQLQQRIGELRSFSVHAGNNEWELP
jgi:hypothetical protein